MSGRREFLRSLASLPLIGGSVALVGNPTAAAITPSLALMDRYVAWLAHEHAAALAEHAEWGCPGFRYVGRAREHMPMYWFPEVPDVEATIAATRPSTRAAVILSTAGCGLQEAQQ